MNKRFGKIAIVVIIILAALLFVVSFHPARDSNIVSTLDGPTKAFALGPDDGPADVSHFDLVRFGDFAINLAQHSIPLGDILSGGPGKDGIPALTDPAFVSISRAAAQGLDQDVTGIFIETQSGGKFYPYTILVWHEIINDTIDGVPVAVTFCPLCGSAIAYQRTVGDEVLEFGVSGFLWESNMVMYNRPNRNGHENFWSQSRGDQVVGSGVGTQLDIHPIQLRTFAEVVASHPQAQVVSAQTGHSRDYGFFPYGNYNENERILFKTSIQDERFHPKEMFFIIPHGDISLALHEKGIPTSGSAEFEYDGVEYILATEPDGSFRVHVAGEKDTSPLPGYYEMWFSWAIHHQVDGVVWEF